MKRSSWLAFAGVFALVASAAVAGEKGRWGEKAGLSKEQAEKLKESFKEGQKTMRPLHRELRDAMTKLHDQVEDDADEAALKGTLERIEKAHQALLSERTKFHTKLAASLPVKQRAKLLLARHHGMGMRMMRMRGRFGPQGMHRMGHGGRGPGPGKEGMRPNDKEDDDTKDAVRDDDENEDEDDSDKPDFGD